MKITDAKVLITCPGRNFVTLKISTDEGAYPKPEKPPKEVVGLGVAHSKENERRDQVEKGDRG